jgi:predicted TIM-barrel fold metal-dependent hydrolase
LIHVLTSARSFETARTLEDLAVSQTLLNFTNLEYVIPHSGGAWASTIDRLLKAYPAIYQPTLNVLTGPRFWWDSAGPTYYHQVEGLLAYGVPPSQLLFGTDYPYAPGFTQTGSLAAVQNSQWVNAAQKAALLSTNAETLLGSRLPSA